MSLEEIISNKLNKYTNYKIHMVLIVQATNVSTLEKKTEVAYRIFVHEMLQ